MAKIEKKYTKKRVDTIVQLTKNLTPVCEICKQVGMSQQSFYNWYNKIPEFKQLIDEANDETMQKVKNTAIKSIITAMQDDYKAAAWWLERKFSEEFGRKDKIDTNMTIDAIKIKYVVPNNVEKLEQKNTLSLPPDNEQVRIELPDSDI